MVLTRLTEPEIKLLKRVCEDEKSDGVKCKVAKLEVMAEPSSVIANSEVEPLVEISCDTDHIDERCTMIETQQNEIFALKKALVNRDSWLKTELEEMKTAHMKEIESLSESLSQLKEINQKSELHRNMMLDANEKLTKTASENNVLIQKLKKTEEERECLRNQIETFHRIKRDEIRNLEDERCEAMDSMSRMHNNEMQVLKKNYESKTAKDYDSYIDEIGKLKETIEQFDSKLANQEKVWLNKNEKLNVSHRDILNRHIDDNERLQKQIQYLVEKSREEAETYDQGIALLIKSRDNLKQQHEAERTDWKIAKEAEFEKIKKIHGDRLEEMQAERSEMIRKYEDKLDDKRDDCKRMDKELALQHSKMKILRENQIRNITKLKLELAKSIETNNSRIRDLEKSNHVLQSEKTVLIGELGRFRAESIQWVGMLNTAANEKNVTIDEPLLKKEILNLRQMLEQVKTNGIFHSGMQTICS